MQKRGELCWSGAAGGRSAGGKARVVVARGLPEQLSLPPHPSPTHPPQPQATEEEAATPRPCPRVPHTEARTWYLAPCDSCVHFCAQDLLQLTRFMSQPRARIMNAPFKEKLPESYPYCIVQSVILHFGKCNILSTVLLTAFQL